MSTQVLSTKAASAVMSITKILAKPSRNAVSRRWVTPRKGHNPKNMDRVKLFTNKAETNIHTNSFMTIAFCVAPSS